MNNKERFGQKKTIWASRTTKTSWTTNIHFVCNAAATMDAPKTLKLFSLKLITVINNLISKWIFRTKIKIGSFIIIINASEENGPTTNRDLLISNWFIQSRCSIVQCDAFERNIRAMRLKSDCARLSDTWSLYSCCLFSLSMVQGIGNK